MLRLSVLPMPRNIGVERCEMAHKPCERKHMSGAIATRDELFQRVREVVGLGDGNRKAAIAWAAKVLDLPFDRVRRLYYGQARRIEAHEADQIRAYVEQASALIQSRAEFEALREAFIRNRPSLARLVPPALPRTQAIEEAEQAVAVAPLDRGRA